MVFDLSIAFYYFTGGGTIASNQRSITGLVRLTAMDLGHNLFSARILPYHFVAEARVVDVPGCSIMCNLYAEKLFFTI